FFSQQAGLQKHNHLRSQTEVTTKLSKIKSFRFSLSASFPSGETVYPIATWPHVKGANGVFV
ncbi:hypothetical protein, partial [Bremerella cremea]|uniref:hypothetical protein n=1 Tax=Bremerella cremea TaxID=1031537 RepID=UPI0031F0B8DD